jgi:hypothetical protein
VTAVHGEARKKPPFGTARGSCGMIANSTKNNQSAAQARLFVDALIMPDRRPDRRVALCRACSGQGWLLACS